MPISLRQLQDEYTKNNLEDFTVYDDGSLRIGGFEDAFGNKGANTNLGAVIQSDANMLAGLDQTRIKKGGAVNWNDANGISQTVQDGNWQRAQQLYNSGTLDNLYNSILQKNSLATEEAKNTAFNQLPGNHTADQQRAALANTTKGDTGFRFYEQGGYYTVNPWAGNIPYGHKEVTKQEFEQNESRLRKEDPNRWNPFFDDIRKNYANAFNGGESGYTMKDGVPWKTSDLNKEAENEAAVKAGTMKKVVIGNGFGYIPTGSPADTLTQQNGATQTGGTQNAGIPVSTYSGPSIVEYLKSVGQASDFTSRAAMAKTLGISNYSGTDKQNTQMLTTLRNKGMTGNANNIDSSVGAGMNNGQGTPNSGTQNGGGTQTGGNQTTKTSLTGNVTLDALLEKLKGTSPQTTATQVYKQIYDDMGLSSIKTQYEGFSKEYSDLQNKKSDEMLEINNNPWYTEGKRVMELRKLDTKYEGKEGNLTDKIKLLETMYDNGRQDAQYLTGQTLNQTEHAQKLTQDVILKAIDLAEKQADAVGKLTGPSSVQEYQYAKSQGYNGSYTDWLNEDANRKVTKGSSGGGGGTPTVAKQKDLIESMFKNGLTEGGKVIFAPRGKTDGFVDPYAYLEALKQWTGTTQAFLSAFPIKTHINSKSYNLLPTSIRPTTGGTGTGGGGTGGTGRSING